MHVLIPNIRMDSYLLSWGDSIFNLNPIQKDSYDGVTEKSPHSRGSGKV